ncbi:MAG: Fic family protein [Muribaculaceae bacterium]|nr:Fic family protein [Muribaculaceae bacterium]
MLESTPKLNDETFVEAIGILHDPSVATLLRKIDRKYLYWDKVKYLAPEPISPEILWQAVKISRGLQMKTLHFGKYNFRFTITERMLLLLHQFDLNCGGSLSSDGLISDSDKKYILTSSIMEEAIASSQMEGANTTRKVAKEMLRKQSAPKNNSERMIVNNYNTIKFISEISSEDFSVDLIRRIHKMISNSTLDELENEGKFRDNNDIFVMNALTGEIAHTPPSYEEIGVMLQDLCDFANDSESEIFVHPIIKGIIIHFILAFIHPFCDGNGRTARSLVYWHLLKNKYWFVEYLSISRIIYRSKPKYERAFLCAENDNLDLSYFILYHLEVMEEAFNELKEYLRRKIHEKSTLDAFTSIAGITRRQAEILSIICEAPGTTVSVKEIANRFGLNNKSVRNDLRNLSKLNLITEIPINGREFGYERAHNLEEIIEKIGKK